MQAFQFTLIVQKTSSAIAWSCAAFEYNDLKISLGNRLQELIKIILFFDN